MGKGIENNATLSLFLQRIIANRIGSIQPLFNVQPESAFRLQIE